MDYYFGPHVNIDELRMNPPLGSDSNYRYSLEIPFKFRPTDGPVAYVIMKNPSNAGKLQDGLVKSDLTVNKVCIYFYVRRFSKVIILNLASLYATRLSSYSHSSIFELVSPESDICANDDEINAQLSQYREGIDIIAVGWGGKNEVKGSKLDYDQRIIQVINIINRYTDEIYMFPSNLTYPIHPAHKNGWNEWQDLVRI